jgi:hypothetical protein
MLLVPHFVRALSARGRLRLGFECRKSGKQDVRLVVNDREVELDRF